MFNKVGKFISEVSAELKKVAWSSRKELLDATWLVLISSMMLGVYIGAVDFALSKFLRLIIR